MFQYVPASHLRNVYLAFLYTVHVPDLMNQYQSSDKWQRAILYIISNDHLQVDLKTNLDFCIKTTELF